MKRSLEEGLGFGGKAVVTEEAVITRKARTTRVGRAMMRRLVFLALRLNASRKSVGEYGVVSELRAIVEVEQVPRSFLRVMVGAKL